MEGSVTFDPEGQRQEPPPAPSSGTTGLRRRGGCRGKLMGRLTVAEVVDLVYEESDTDLRRMGDQ